MKFFKSYYFIFKLSLWGAIICCPIFIVMALIDSSSISIPVRPPYNAENATTLAAYSTATVYALGKLEIHQPSLLQRIVFPNFLSIFDVFRILFWLFLSIPLLLLVNTIDKNSAFRDNAARYLRMTGFIMILFFILEPVRNAYLNQEVLALTEKRFRLLHDFGFDNQLKLWIGLLAIWFSRSYKKATQLQAEQDLTV
ncbi:DUF2975 domain-containing protein [Aridibaculum aurantiacum]|uniref:DUF2975 domain-containing protein n=1 Tax=Aridibaculum aurantiacum TaxID=2810307 RepID=UPI001A9769CD|nr:DUF2975 domain-containing protein [Aridibaculum aurantiacum]